MRQRWSLRSLRVPHPIRGIVRKGRGGLNRLAHPIRRHRAREKLKAVAPLERVLLLCLGNICRSPFGEARLQEMGRSDGGLQVRSAGFIGPGRPSPENARVAALERGLDLEGHRSQLVTPELVRWAELVVVMDPTQERALRHRFGAASERMVVLGDLDPRLPGRRGIPDPVDRPVSFFSETYERMDRCLAELFPLIRGFR